MDLQQLAVETFQRPTLGGSLKDPINQQHKWDIFYHILQPVGGLEPFFMTFHINWECHHPK
jgi:hypothetical protein